MPLTLSVGTNARLKKIGTPTMSLMVRQLLGRNDLADLVLDLQHQLLGLLDARADRRAEVQLDDADIGGREEIGADHARQDDAHAADQQHSNTSTNGRWRMHHLQHAAIAVAHTVEAALAELR